MATDDDRSGASGGYSGAGSYPTGGAHHFDDGTRSFGRDAYDNAYDNTYDRNYGKDHDDSRDGPYGKDDRDFGTTGFTPVADLEPGPAHYDDEDERRPFGWSGSADLGLLVLRLALGAAFVVHGLQKVFGLLGGPGIDGFERYLQAAGFREARILAWVTGVTELAGGGLLVLGLFTPLAAAGVLGVMANVIALKFRGGFFAPNGVELEVAYAAMAFGLLFAGPGRVALDRNRGWFRHPLMAGFLCLLLAAGATTATLYVFR